MRDALRRSRPCLLLTCLAGAACADGDAEGPRVGRGERALAAQCTVTVVGFGQKDVETDYLPNVVNCENGDADTEELKAQAVAARTYLYYKLGATGTSITSSTSNQVYDCARKKYLDQKHFDAVKATAGQVLMHGGLVIWSCYNAGTERTPPDCKPTGGGADSCVTFNEGKSGDEVTPSPCGHPDNPKNRGCMSQNGGHCLSLSGRTYPEILRYYYGADIDIVPASGGCVTPPPDAGAPSPDVASGGGPARDAGSDPVVAADGGALAAPDSAVSPGHDGGSTASLQRVSAGDEPPQLYGGCAITAEPGAAGSVGWLALALFAILAGQRRRRRAPRG